MIRAIANTKNCLNDLRTIYLVHDKRLLTVLCNTEIMQKWLTFEEAKFLKTHIIPSYNIKMSDPKFIEFVINNRESFMIKPTLLGKGHGIIFGKNCF